MTGEAKKIFGTDGARGVANTELTPELAFAMGRAGAYILSEKKGTKAQILVGKDTRLSCDMLEAALVAGICSVGADAVLVGVIPTPGVAYLVKSRQMDAGVMISASHNPMEDNGIKFFDGTGYKLDDQSENQIENIIHNHRDLPRPFGENIGIVIRDENLQKDYIDFLKTTVNNMSLSGLKIALDLGNGATYKIAPEVFEELGAKVYSLHNSPDGKNINANCGSTHMESLVEFIKENPVDLGIAFDGDGDRCLAADSKGNIIDGDELMSIYAACLKEKNVLKNNTLVITIMSNFGLKEMASAKGITIEETKVGDRYVLEAMLNNNHNFGGEQSGHFIFLDYTTTGDGILSALQLAKIMKETGQSLEELNTQMVKKPQITVNAKVPNNKKEDFDKPEQIAEAVNALKQKYENLGQVIVRPSGTEPNVRITIKGQDQEIITKEANELKELVEKILN